MKLLIKKLYKLFKLAQNEIKIIENSIDVL